MRERILENRLACKVRDLRAGEADWGACVR